jgi:hypothetical protein
MVVFDDLIDNCKSKTGAVIVAIFVLFDAEKAVENKWNVFWRYANSLI